MEVKVIEKKAKSVDEAVQLALLELECDIEDVSVEVIEEPSKGLWGIGKKPALVRLTMKEKIKSVSQENDIKKVVEDILNKMRIDYQIDYVEEDDAYTRINIIGNDMGLLIGRKGETLDALQFVVSLIVNRNTETRSRIILDVENYRKKRDESLEELALSLSEKVKSTRRNVVMRPMNPQERRIVHTALQEDSQIVTFSTGEDPNRKVVISLKK